MKLLNYSDKKYTGGLLKRPLLESAALEKTVEQILRDVKKSGDSALKKYSLKFDKIKLDSFLVTTKEISEAKNLISKELRKAMQLAKKNIEKFHSAQKETSTQIETTKGVLCWRKSVGIEKIGLYIPGGSAPLFSTVLMLGVPAKLAGCKEIILCTPPGKKGKIDPAILYAATLVGVTKIYKVGGAQAIAAMAYGTESIPKVFKIFGPGNQFVTCAKQLITKEGIAIDMPAGPSEVAVIADDSCIPSYVAADLLSQAEHGADSQVILVSDDEQTIKKVISEINLQIKKLPRKDIAAKALTNSRAILVKDLDQGMQLLNDYAPEHLIMACKDYKKFSGQVINAGSVFLGNFSCESAGDYASGTNHTLPTNGHAKAYSGVSLDSFVKKITFQEISKKGIRKIGSAIELLAEAEGLHAHKNAVTIRLKK
ncbi:MAG: histidinol dehydrogenase [Bacteroidetes bacterium]|nr:histidinol dehydrogenase [Bacteroidota bacterium]